MLNATKRKIGAVVLGVGLLGIAYYGPKVVRDVHAREQMFAIQRQDKNYVQKYDLELKIQEEQMAQERRKNELFLLFQRKIDDETFVKRYQEMKDRVSSWKKQLDSIKTTYQNDPRYISAEKEAADYTILFPTVFSILAGIFGGGLYCMNYENDESREQVTTFVHHR